MLRITFTSVAAVVCALLVLAVEGAPKKTKKPKDDDCDIVYCFVDPCVVNTHCPGYPTATCVSNYCGGCNAEFFAPDGTQVECDCGIRPLVNCFADPCQVTTCEKHPRATCFANYCAGCNANFYQKGKEVKC